MALRLWSRRSVLPLRTLLRRVPGGAGSFEVASLDVVLPCPTSSRVWRVSCISTGAGGDRGAEEATTTRPVFLRSKTRVQRTRDSLAKTGRSLRATREKVTENVEQTKRIVTERMGHLRENVMTIPNALSMARLCSSPVLGYLVVTEGYTSALVLFAAAGVTDVLDGWVARSFPSQQSMLGTVVDPLADKCLVATLFLSLTVAGLIPVPLTALIVARDVTLVGCAGYLRFASLPAPKTFLRFFDVSLATVKFSPTSISKANTAVQLGLVAATLAAPVFGFVDHSALHAFWAVAALRTKLAWPWKHRPRISEGKGTTQQTSTLKADFVVTVEQPTTSESGKAACSLMVARLLWYNRLTRFFGCLFVSNLSGKTLKNAVATWKSPYTVYAALWFSTFLGYQVIALTSTSRSVDVHKTFPRYLRFVSYAVSVAKVCVNYVSFCLGSEGLLEFMRSATAFETSSSFSPAVKRRLDRGRRLFDGIVRAMLLASFVGAFIIALTDGMRKLPPASLPWRVVIGTVVLCSEVTFFLYDSMLHVITTRCSKVLLRYLESELVRLEANCSNRMTVTHYAQLGAVSKIAAVRVNVCKIKALKGNLDKICGPAIVASCSSLLALLCLNVYRSFTLDVTELELWLPIVYTLYCALCLVEMAFVSDDLAKQARRLKDTTKTVTMIHSPKEYLQQIRYVHSTIEPDEMCLTGASFFRLDRGLLLAVTGSVITFAVILMQTGGDLKRRMGLH